MILCSHFFHAFHPSNPHGVAFEGRFVVTFIQVAALTASPVGRALNQISVARIGIYDPRRIIHGDAVPVVVCGGL